MLRLAELPYAPCAELTKLPVRHGHDRHIVAPALQRPHRLQTVLVADLAAPEALQLGGEGQVLRRLELRRCDLERDVASPAQLSDPLRVHVEADGLVLLAKLDRERQADVAQPHHSDARPAPLRPHPSALSLQTPARCTSGAGGSRTAGVSGSSLTQRHRPPLSLVMSASIASWASSSSGVATSTASGAAGRTGTRAGRAPSTPGDGAPCSVRASALCPPVIPRYTSARFR